MAAKPFFSTQFSTPTLSSLSSSIHRLRLARASRVADIVPEDPLALEENEEEQKPSTSS